MSHARNSPVLNRAVPLFDKHVPTQGFSVHSGNIVLRVLEGKRNVGQLTEDVVHFEITDEKDPFVIYYIDASEATFSALKEEHKLSIPFNDLSRILIELIERCLVDSFPRLNSLTPPTSFTTRLNTETCMFSVIERTHYSNEVVHMSLPLTRGDDQSIKEYLASRLELQLSVSASQANNIRDLRQSLASELELKGVALEELHHIKTKSEVDQQSAESAHSLQMSELQMQCSARIEDFRQKYEADLHQARSELSQAVAAAQAERTKYENEINDMKQQRMELEAVLKETTRKLQIEVQSRERMESEWMGVSSKKGEIESLHMTVVGDKVKLEAQVELLNQALTSKQQAIEQQKVLHATSEEARRGLEERLQELQQLHGALQRDHAAASEEIARRGELSARLEDKLQKCIEKINLKNEILRKQEGAVSEWRDKQSDTSTLLVQAREGEKTLQLQLDGVSQQLQDTLSRLDESTGNIAKMNEVITYLNEQINQYELGGTFASPSHNQQSYTTAASTAPHTVTPTYNNSTGGKSYTPGARFEHSAPYSASSVAKSESFGISPQTVNIYKSTTTAASRGQEGMTSFVQGYKSISATTSAPAGGVGDDRYRAGLRNLGLESEFGDDFLRNLHSPQPSLDLSHEEVDLDMLGYYSLAGENTKRSTKTGAQGTTGASPPHKSSRLPVRQPATALPVVAGGGAGSAVPRYAWQSPDFV